MIQYSAPGIWYILFYLLAFFCGLVYLLIQGKRNGYPPNPWMLTIFSSLLFFVVGCKIFLFSNGDWLGILMQMEWPTTQGRTVIGGILFGFAGILLGIAWFRLPYRILDSFAILLPLTLLLQRTGCFLAGCCYGLPSDLPWAVSYGSHYHAYNDHVISGLIDSNAASSLAVHPVQLYEILGCLMIIVLVEIVRKKRWLKAPGTLLLFSTVLYSVVRFADEYFRATHAPFIGGLNKVQVYVLLIGVISVLLLLNIERKYSPGFQPAGIRTSFTRELLFFFALAFLYAISWGVVDTLEVVALYPVVIFSIASILYASFEKLTLPSMRWSTAGLMLLTVLLMSQIAPEKETKSEEQNHYYTVAMGVLSGNHSLVDEVVSEDCDGNRSFTVAKFKEKYTSGSMQISRSNVSGKDIFTYGLGGQYGKLEENGEDNVNTSRSLTTYAINPFVRYDMRYFGIGGGINVGDMPVLRHTFDTEQATLIRRFRAYPQIYLRGGELRTFFGEFRFGDGLGGTFPASQLQISAGYGFHRTNGAAIRMGTSSYAGFIFSASLPVTKQLMIEPYLGAGSSMFNEFDREENFQTAVRLLYRFGESR